MHVQYEMIQCSSFREVQSVYLMIEKNIRLTAPDYNCVTTDI